ncbi:MAG TPA: hypothetical protein VL460_00290 [Caulobacteraceae bacterium]|jgi:DNA-binding MarR family transcriptional regulator|nr:hypothetical protein [Caulobacteraceae bacterium]
MKARSRPQKEQAKDQLVGGLNFGFLENSVTFHLRLAQTAAARRFAVRTGDNTMAPGWLSLLHLIGKNPGIAPTALSMASGREKSTLTPAMRVMRDRGYLTLGQLTSDRRRYTLELTAAGYAELARLTEYAMENEQLVDTVLGEDKALMLQLLYKLEKAFEITKSDSGASRPKRTRHAK